MRVIILALCVWVSRLSYNFRQTLHINKGNLWSFEIIFLPTTLIVELCFLLELWYVNVNA